MEGGGGGGYNLEYYLDYTMTFERGHGHVPGIWD